MNEIPMKSGDTQTFIRSRSFYISISAPHDAFKNFDRESITRIANLDYGKNPIDDVKAACTEIKFECVNQGIKPVQVLCMSPDCTHFIEVTQDDADRIQAEHEAIEAENSFPTPEGCRFVNSYGDLRYGDIVFHPTQHTKLKVTTVCHDVVYLNGDSFYSNWKYNKREGFLIVPDENWMPISTDADGFITIDGIEGRFTLLHEHYMLKKGYKVLHPKDWELRTVTQVTKRVWKAGNETFAVKSFQYSDSHNGFLVLKEE